MFNLIQCLTDSKLIKIIFFDYRGLPLFVYYVTCSYLVSCWFWIDCHPVNSKFITWHNLSVVQLQCPYLGVSIYNIHFRIQLIGIENCLNFYFLSTATSTSKSSVNKLSIISYWKIKRNIKRFVFKKIDDCNFLYQIIYKLNINLP